jgi:hypothetical protein
MYTCCLQLISSFECIHVYIRISFVTRAINTIAIIKNHQLILHVELTKKKQTTIFIICSKTFYSVVYLTFVFLFFSFCVSKVPKVPSGNTEMRKQNHEENALDENLKTILSTTPNIGTANTLMVTFENPLAHHSDVKRFNEIVQIKKGFKLKYVLCFVLSYSNYWIAFTGYFDS